MPGILFIAAHRINRSPSQRYRFEQYLTFLEANGFHWEISPIISEKDDRVFYSNRNYLRKFFILVKAILIRIRDLQRAKKFDIIFIQRESLMIGLTFFEKRIKRKGLKLVFDFDDSIWLLDTSEGNKKFEWLKNPDKTKISITLANKVFAGNSYLKQYADSFNSEVMVIPTTIDTDFHKPLEKKKNDDKIIIGWSGSITTIKHFEWIVPVLKKIKDRYREKIAFMVMGDASYENEALGIKGIPWTATEEVNILNQFDIGIMPLPDDKWAKGKCGLKGLSYMSCEIPTIMSAVGVNNEIINHGVNGFLAKTYQEWEEILTMLIESKVLRTKTGVAARQTVIDKFSVKAWKEVYLRELNALVQG